MAKLYIKNNQQQDAYSTPWSKKEAVLVRVWEVIWTLFICWMPKMGSPLYVFALRAFGASIPSHAFIHPSARIYAPWLLSVGDHSCLGSKCEIYNLGPVSIGDRTTLAQYSYICNGTHDFSNKKMQLLIGRIAIGNDVFIGAKSIILPGLTIADGCVIGAGGVLTKNTEDNCIYAGNPARFVKKRNFII